MIIESLVRVNLVVVADPRRQLAHFERAIAVARQQQAKSWELRAAMSMARLSRDQGKRDEPASFSLRSTAGSLRAFDTRDLKEAKALLDELES